MPQLADQQWPADAVERRPVADLVPYARNARTHSDAQVDQIAASMREWGVTTPILVDEAGTIIAGHARVMAARKLGLAELPVMVARGWTEAQRQAYVIADNKLAENAGWDQDLLRVELGALNDADFDLGLTGFSDDELQALLAESTPVGNTDPDDTPEIQEIVIARPGETWVLGSHRLRCGDSTSADDVAALLAGVRPHLMVTDPPYGVEYDAGWRNKALAGKPRADGKVGGGGRAVGKVSNDGEADWREAWALFPGEVAYVWHAGSKSHIVAESLLACKFDLRAQIIWAKNQFVIGRGHYHPHHEPCFYAVRGKGHWNGDRKQSTLWQVDKPQKSETGHSTQKPVECMARPMRNNSTPGQAVYEPFSGSGSSIIAAEMEGRSCLAMELHPAYVDMAIRRWQAFTGKAASLEGDGRSFNEVEGERGADAPPDQALDSASASTSA